MSAEKRVGHDYKVCHLEAQLWADDGVGLRMRQRNSGADVPVMIADTAPYPPPLDGESRVGPNDVRSTT